MDLPDNILEELDYLDNITSCNKVYMGGYRIFPVGGQRHELKKKMLRPYKDMWIILYDLFLKKLKISKCKNYKKICDIFFLWLASWV